MTWKVAQAKQHLSKLLRAAAEEPQRIQRRNRMVAAVIDADTFEEFEAWRRKQSQGSIADCFVELRALCADEDYELPVAPREDRANAFLAVLEESA